MYCPTCGAQNEPGDRFCFKCGVSLPKPSESLAPLQSKVLSSPLLWLGLAGLAVVFVLGLALTWGIFRHTTPGEGEHRGTTPPTVATVVVIQTPSAGSPLPSMQPSPPTPTTMPRPTATPIPTAKPPPTATPPPTNTPAITPMPTSTSACPNEPQGVFHNIWVKYKDRLGCPHQIEPIGGFYAEQPFQNGHMYWSKIGQLYLIVFGDSSGTWRIFSEDESPWKEGMPPESCTVTVPPNLVQPIRGFGGLWCAHSDIREQIGWGTDIERGFEDDLIQEFEGGIIFRDSEGRNRRLAYVLFRDDMSFVKDSY